MYDKAQIGINIQTIRIQKNLTQEELAGLIDSDRTVISRLESGQKNCSIDYLLKIAEALNVSTDMLLTSCSSDNKVTQLNTLLSDCTNSELSIILDVVASLKEALRKSTR